MERRGGTERFKSFDGAKREEKEALAKVPAEAIILSDDDESRDELHCDVPEVGLALSMYPICPFHFRAIA